MIKTTAQTISTILIFFFISVIILLVNFIESCVNNSTTNNNETHTRADFLVVSCQADTFPERSSDCESAPAKGEPFYIIDHKFKNNKKLLIITITVFNTFHNLSDNFKLIPAKTIAETQKVILRRVVPHLLSRKSGKYFLKTVTRSAYVSGKSKTYIHNPSIEEGINKHIKLTNVNIFNWVRFKLFIG